MSTASVDKKGQNTVKTKSGVPGKGMIKSPNKPPFCKPSTRKK